MLHLDPVDHELTRYESLSLGSSSDQGTTHAQKGSTGRKTPPRGQYPRSKEQRDETKGDRMKHDLLGIGSQFETKK